MKYKKEVLEFLERLSERVGEVIDEYDWREICTLITCIQDEKDESPSTNHLVQLSDKLS